ncbi:MAG: hypothetical protein EXS05_03090 [Planctomycetaceae bacterium]|nr:hypothetical protein [Planctomycetaceae bacterium]
MSRRPKSNASPIALFTFLDTLMCTMGALILLLIALSIKMRPKASLEESLAPAAAIEQPVAEPPLVDAPPAAPVYTREDRERDLAEQAARRQDRFTQWSAAVAAAQAQRDLDQQQLLEHQQILSKAQRKLREAQARARQAGDQNQAVAQEQHETRAAVEKLNSLEEQLAQQIEVTRRNLDLEERKQATKSNEYALVPYDGTSGTMRRPIYIECSHRGFRFIPENVTVAGDELEGFRESFNPLLMGTQALLRYWNLRRRESGGDEPEPYVLLIVRPSGSLAYYLARQLLTPVGAHFGYELVEEDWKLALPDPDPQAVAALRDAIEITVEAGQRVRATLAANGRGRGGGYSSNYRNVPQDPFSENLDDELPRSGSDGGRRGSGFSNRPSNGEFGSGAGRGNGDSHAAARGTGRTGSPDAGSAQPAGTGAGAGGSGSAKGTAGKTVGESQPAGQRSGGVIAARPGSGASGAAGQGAGQPASGATQGESNGPAGSGRGSKPRVLAANMSGRPGSSSGSGSATGFGDDQGDRADETHGGKVGDDRAGADAAHGGRRDQSARAYESENDGAAGSGRSGRGSRRGAARAATISGTPPDAAGDSVDAAEQGGESLRRPSRDRGATDAPGDGGAEPPLVPLPDEVARPYGHVPRPAGRNQEREPGRLRELEPDRSERKPDREAANENQPRQFGQSSGDRPWLKDDSAPNASNSRGGGARFGGPSSGGGGDGGPSDPALLGGKRRWGQSHARAGIGLERKVEIRAKADHLLIGPDVAVSVNPNEKPEELLQKIQAGLEETAQAWGPPPANFFWLPAVRFVVYPGGNTYYERVRGLLQKSGVNSTVQYHLDKPAAEKQPAAAKAGGPRR